MVKNTVHTFQKMNRDLVEGKTPPQFYYDAHNIRFITNSEVITGGFSFEKGNEKVITIPQPTINARNTLIEYVVNGVTKTLTYSVTGAIQPRCELEANYYISINNYRSSGRQVIMGHAILRDTIIFLTTDDNGFDCMWEVNDETFDISLLYMRDIDLSTNNPIQILNNFENDSIDKVYWVDSAHQMRFINTKHSIANSDLEELIDLPVSSIQMVGSFDINQPIIKEVLSGGSHTAGMIQYAYSLYRLNSSQSKISPLSDLVSLDKGILGGGDLNEVVGSIPVIEITDIDKNFSHIRTYAIKYTSYNQTPSISLIDEREIPSGRSIELFDDGNVISTLTLSEFLFLGSDIIVPKHINSKDGRMFYANYKEVNFDVDLDFRAYSFNSLGVAPVYDNIFSTLGVLGGTLFTVTPSNYLDPALNKFDSINLDYNNNKYQSDMVTIGGEGKYIKYELTQEVVKTENSKFLKDQEIYRIGIELFNNYGQYSLPKWVADFRAQEGNLQGNYNSLEVILKPDFFLWLNNPTNFPTEYDKPVGYRILIAERTSNDRTIVSNGLLNTMMVVDRTGNQTPSFPNKQAIGTSEPKLPNFLVRNVGDSIFGNTAPLVQSNHLADMNLAAHSFLTEVQLARYFDKDTAGRLYQFNMMMQLYSPETIFKESVSLNDGLKLRIKGGLKNSYNAVWSRVYDTVAGSATSEVRGFNGVSPFFAAGYAGDPKQFRFGMISQPDDSDPNRAILSQYYRVYGDANFTNNSNVNPNIVLFQNQFNLLPGSNPDPSPNPTPGGSPILRIGFSSAQRAVSIFLDPTLDRSEVIYDIVPDVGYNGVSYEAKICSDITGTNVLATTGPITGNSSVNFSDTFVFVPITNEDQTFNYYLFIEASVAFSCDVDVTGYAGTSVTHDTVKQKSLANQFSETLSVIASTFNYTPAPNVVSYDIYGTPELTTKGQQFKSYNGDPKWRYSNSIESVLTDGDTSFKDDGIFGRKIISINSHNNRCITMVLGDNNPANISRSTLFDLYDNSGLTGDSWGLVGELVKSDSEIYLGKIYGGNSYEDKKRSNYIEIGEYKKFSDPLSYINHIDSPGDTYVNNFRFNRMTKTGNEYFAQGVMQIGEIVEFLVETTVDLKNRNDLSLNNWDSKFLYTDDDYHKYNRVYSQNPNLILRRDNNFNFKKVKSFDTNVIASKVKTPGELIDNWTDIQQNEILTMDGKYGAINGLISFKDKLFTFQDKGIAFLSINPRVQVQGADGFQIELGKGAVLNEYKYITSNSGSINKWGIISTESGMYYLDALNKSFNVVGDEMLGLSDKEGFHKEFLNRIDIPSIKDDNPILHRGASLGWDKITNDLYISVFNGDDMWTLSYNLAQGGFSSTYDYNSSMYPFTKGKMLTIDPLNQDQLYLNFAGKYNVFYGLQKPSKMSFIVNPEPMTECTFNNLEYNSEAFDENGNEVDYTWEKIQATNEFQDSGIVNLISRFNIRKLNRKWRLNIPRDSNKVNRIRNTWALLTLISDNIDNYRYLNNDIITYYNANYKIIQ